MSDTLTLDALAVPMRALRLLTAEFGHLPAPCVDMSTIFPERLVLALHETEQTGGTLAAFESWRDALGIAPDAVTFAVQSDGRTRVLAAETRFGGAEIALRAFADTQPAAAGRSGGAA
ncbi:MULTISPECIES: hypothetical protein [unclassified Streptomyces]|uniref:hypothetical protein n=1 Tax=unclassified Streptomyces TaxID=2593676 RepID=UPI003425DBE5